MPAAEFEEKEFEIVAAIELAATRFGSRTVWSPGQVLEKLVGFDAAADPARAHPIWRVLGVRRPAGVRLVPDLWQVGRRPPAGRLPSSVTSLIFQYKRPEFLAGGRAAQWRFWRRPYFRFTRTHDQQVVLARLERSLGDTAVVRYASPAFWRRWELEAAALAREVLTRSGYVRPGSLTSHRVWTYIAPGSDGHANPSGRRAPFETIEVVVRPLLVGPMTDLIPVTVTQSPLAHIQGLARAAADREPTLRHVVGRWMSAVRGQVDISPDQASVVEDFATISTLLARIGASWMLLGAEA